MLALPRGSRADRTKQVMMNDSESPANGLTKRDELHREHSGACGEEEAPTNNQGTSSAIIQPKRRVTYVVSNELVKVGGTRYYHIFVLKYFHGVRFHHYSHQTETVHFWSIHSSNSMDSSHPKSRRISNCKSCRPHRRASEI